MKRVWAAVDLAIGAGLLAMRHHEEKPLHRELDYWVSKSRLLQEEAGSYRHRAEVAEAKFAGVVEALDDNGWTFIPRADGGFTLLSPTPEPEPPAKPWWRFGR